MTHGRHHHDHEHQSDARLAWAVAANVALTVAQIIGGIFAGSLSLAADALHNLNDAAALGLALLARRIARRPADRLRTFGYRRAEVIGALINVTALTLIGLYLVYEAVVRFFDPQPVKGWIVVFIAGAALAVDLATAALTYAMSRQSINVRAAFIHNVSDALASVAVIISGTLIILFDWYVADLVATLLISGYILWQSARLLPRAVGILMEGVPPGLDVHELTAAMREVDDVVDVHQIHAWELGEHNRAIEAHIVVDTDDIETLERVKHELRQLCADRFHTDHTTFELEWPEHALCPTTSAGRRRPQE